MPTTAGTAAEVTINYVITDVEKKRNFVCVDPHDMPVIAAVVRALYLQGIAGHITAFKLYFHIIRMYTSVIEYAPGIAIHT